jgi:putative restriction endonuclease
MPVHEKVNQLERAFRAWKILTKRAAEQTPITYGDLASALGIHHRAVRYVLGPIQDYCMGEHLPPLTILVVNQSEGVPGSGFIAWDADDIATGIRQVYTFNWMAIENPFGFAADKTTEEEIIAKLVNNPESAADVYRLVKVRGIAQVLFRQALLRVYDYQCAFCGFSFSIGLEAAHIVPWSKATHQQRLDVSNGILLCSNHHKLFDSGLITLDEKGRVAYYDPSGEDSPYSNADNVMSIELHGKPALLPKNQKHKPSTDALKSHHKSHGW